MGMSNITENAKKYCFSNFCYLPSFLNWKFSILKNDVWSPNWLILQSSLITDFKFNKNAYGEVAFNDQSQWKY